MVAPHTDRGKHKALPLRHIMAKKKKGKVVTTSGVKIVAQNRRARHDYELLQVYEAGISLTGTEIKSIRANQVTLQHAFVSPRDGELWLLEANISPYEHGNVNNHDPKRARRLLPHRREINKILMTLATNGVTCIPTKLYLKNGRAKLEIAVARGKKKYDKRQDLAKKDAKRQMDRAMKGRY